MKLVGYANHIIMQVTGLVIRFCGKRDGLHNWVHNKMGDSDSESELLMRLLSHRRGKRKNKQEVCMHGS